MEGNCYVCGKEAISRCSTCKAAFYCGRECQTFHWVQGGHQNECEKIGILTGPRSPYRRMEDGFRKKRMRNKKKYVTNEEAVRSLREGVLRGRVLSDKARIFIEKFIKTNETKEQIKGAEALLEKGKKLSDEQRREVQKFISRGKTEVKEWEDMNRERVKRGIHIYDL